MAAFRDFLLLSPWVWPISMRIWRHDRLASRVFAGDVGVLAGNPRAKAKMGGEVEMTRVVLRPAEPSVKEGRIFARLLDQAQESWFRAALGRRAPDIIAHAYTQPGHELSYLYVTFAERDGRILGMAAGYPAETHRAFTGQPLRTAAGWRRFRLAAFARISRRLLRFMDSIPDGDFYVRGVAVEPMSRGAGVGTQLMRSLEQTAEAAGSRRLALDVAAKNRGARRLYENLGMTAETESPRWLGLPNTNVIRMTKPLARDHPSRASRALPRGDSS